MSEIADYPGKGNPAVESALADKVWKMKLDPGSKKPFFYNTTTKETTWDLAKTLAKAGGGGDAASGGGKKTFGGKKDVQPAEKKEEPSFGSPTAAVAAEATQPIATAQPAPVQQQPASFFQQQQQLQSAPAQQQQQQQPYTGIQLSDPIQRLLEHNKKLVGDISTHEAEAITAGMSSFETRLDLLVHANNVLAVQLDRRNQEALAMQRALTESHDTIHKLRNENKNLEDMRSLSYAHSSVIGGSSRDGSGMSGDEAKRSVAVALETVGRSVVHLQEQNRSLAATIAQLTSQLMQNVQASNVSRGVESVQDQPHDWWKNSKGYSVAALTSRFLDSPARNALCAKCMMRVSDFRDSLLREVPMTTAEKDAQDRREREDGSPVRGGGGGSGATPIVAGRTQPSYVPVNAFRPSAGAAAGPSSSGGGAALRNSSSSPAGAGAQFTTPKSGGGALSAYR